MDPHIAANELNKRILEILDTQNYRDFIASGHTSSLAVIDGIALSLESEESVLELVDFLTILPDPSRALRQALAKSYVMDPNEFNGDVIARIISIYSVAS